MNTCTVPNYYLEDFFCISNFPSPCHRWDDHYLLNGNNSTYNVEFSIKLVLTTPFLGNLTFVPRGIGTGLAVRNGARLYHLIRNEPPHFDNFEHDIPPTIVGRVIRREILPGYHTEEILPMRVGAPDSTRVLVAVATREESTVEKGVDLIKVRTCNMIMPVGRLSKLFLF